MKSRNLSHILKSEDSAVQKTKPQNFQILNILTVYFPFLKLQQELNCLLGNTVASGNSGFIPQQQIVHYN